MSFLDEIDPVAQKIGAVNTILNRNGRLFGTNTDYAGAVSAIEDVIPVKDRKVIVLGAGGAARAVCAGLAEKGAVVHVANRTPGRARALAEAFGLNWSGLDGIGGFGAQIIINATSVGMRPHEDETPLMDASVFRGALAAMDIVYAPVETRFLKEAGKAGCKTINGLKMLIYQAAGQFELWTGLKAPLKVMEEALTGALV